MPALNLNTIKILQYKTTAIKRRYLDLAASRDLNWQFSSYSRLKNSPKYQKNYSNSITIYYKAQKITYASN